MTWPSPTTTTTATHVPPTTHARPSPRLLPRPRAPGPDPRVPTHIDGSPAPSRATTTALTTCTLACRPAPSLALRPVACHRPVVCRPATTAALYAPSPPPSTPRRCRPLCPVAAVLYALSPPSSTPRRRRPLRPVAAALYAPSPPPYVPASPPRVSPRYPSCIYHRTRLRSSTCLRRARAILARLSG